MVVVAGRVETQLTRLDGFGIMAEHKIFYSWQSDTPRLITRDLVHRAMELAIALPIEGVSVEDSPRVDQDTQGLSGTPSIAETIFQKIRQSSIVVADVTMTGVSIPKNGVKQKKFPNPNVMLELGYAASTLGWPRIVLLLNKYYGSPESLPFDVKFRRFPFCYSLSPSSSQEGREVATIKLAQDLREAFSTCFQAENRLIEVTISRLSGHARNLMKGLGHVESIFKLDHENAPYSQHDSAMDQLMNFGIIRCERSINEQSQWCYYWTNFGFQCIKALGFAAGHRNVEFLGEAGNFVLVDFIGYDEATKDTPE